MPIYDYRCVACAHRFEVIHGVHAEGPASCPACGEGPVVKAVSAPAIHFKGSGWAKMERRTSAGSGSGAATSGSTGSEGGADRSEGAPDKATGDGAGSKSAGGGSPAGSRDAAASKPESSASKVHGGSATGRSEASAGSKGSD